MLDKFSVTMDPRTGDCIKFSLVQYTYIQDTFNL
jgi:hypothetical protein